MTDNDLNLAIHQEVEGWRWCAKPGSHIMWERVSGMVSLSEMTEPRITDYCNDPVWCVQMMEKHGLSPKPRYEGTTGRYLVEWKVWQSDRPVASGSSLTRAVAIAVLQLTREGK